LLGSLRMASSLQFAASSGRLRHWVGDKWVASGTVGQPLGRPWDSTTLWSPWDGEDWRRLIKESDERAKATLLQNQEQLRARDSGGTHSGGWFRGSIHR
jgi:hypothetical protein